MHLEAEVYIYICIVTAVPELLMSVTGGKKLVAETNDISPFTRLFCKDKLVNTTTAYLKDKTVKRLAYFKVR